MIKTNPLFLDDKIDFAMKNYQQKLDPDRHILNDKFIENLREISELFGKVIRSADPNLVAT